MTFLLAYLMCLAEAGGRCDGDSESKEQSDAACPGETDAHQQHP